MSWSHSRVSTYQRCPWLFWARYRQKIRRVRPDLDMSRGTLFHIGMEAHWLGQSVTRTVAGRLDEILEKLPLMEFEPEAHAVDDIETVFKELYDLVLELITRALVFLDGWEPLFVEKKLKLLSMVTIPDLVARDPDKLIWTIDYKVRQTLDSEESDALVWDQQTALQQFAIMQKGVSVVGSRQLQVRGIVPKLPVLNKNGSMSRTLISTDWDTYQAALMEAGLDPADYDDMRIKLQSVTFIRWITHIRGEEELHAIWRNALRAYGQAKRISKSVPPVRNLSSWNCKRCDMNALCQLELGGGHWQELVETGEYEIGTA